MEEIDLFLATDDLMPPGIENDDYDSEGDIHFLKNCLAIIPFPKMSHLTLIIMMIRYFLVLLRNHQMLRSKNKIFNPGIFIEVQSERLLSWEKFSISFTCDPLYLVFDTLLLFSSENKDKVFKPGILSYLLVSHRDKATYDFSENPMMMIAPDLEASRARGFVHRLLELQSLAYGNPIS
uniref:Uncharacterized protein n=1 Tax=Tanacetum cinerariifolium TaxID=118510 RepID=A0A6L2JDY5_TANCI|nr:hypothetical protein [Tanacetum cinerariifolium]